VSGPDSPRPGGLATADRWLPRLLVPPCLFLSGTSLVDGEHPQSAVWLAGGAFWLWRATRSTAPPDPLPPTVDQQWARRVLAEAGRPRGVRAVRALRDAEPALSLLQGKQLADAATD
jgi:hypothetical protein